MATTAYIPTFEARARVVIEPERVDEERRRRVARRRPAGQPVPLVCAGTAAPSMHGARLTRRGRVVVAMAWLLLIVAGALAFVRPWDGPDAPPSVGTTSTVYVQSGDTLWELAGDVAPAADPRETVATIMELNGLSSAGDIRPGDALKVPAGH